MRQKTLVIILLVITFFLLVLCSQPKVKDAFNSIADTIESKITNGVPYYINDYNNNPIGSADRYNTEKAYLNTLPTVTVRGKHIKELQNICDKSCQEQPECSAVDGKYSCVSGYESANQACTCLFQETVSESFTSGSLAKIENDPISIAFQNARYLPKWKMESSFDSKWVPLQQQQFDLDEINWSKDLDEFSFSFWLQVDQDKLKERISSKLYITPIMEIKQNNVTVFSFHILGNRLVGIEQKDFNNNPMYWGYYTDLVKTPDAHMVITYKKNMMSSNNNGIEVFENGILKKKKRIDPRTMERVFQSDRNYHRSPTLENNTLALNRKNVSGISLNKFLVYHHVLSNEEAQFMYLNSHTEK